LDATTFLFGCLGGVAELLELEVEARGRSYSNELSEGRKRIFPGHFGSAGKGWGARGQGRCGK
jgi:hypothetical protein